MADIRLTKPAAGASESVQCEPEARFVFDFPTTDATLARDGDNLTISFEDGSKLQLEGFYQEYNGENLPSFNIDGTEVAAADFFAAMNEPDLMPAAGPTTGTVANGARFHEWGDSALTGGIQHLNGLDWGFARNFEWDDVPNAVGRNGDDWGWWAGRDADAGAADNPVSLVPENPVPVPPGTEIPGGGEPGGGEPGNHGIVPPGDVRVVSEAGLRHADTVSVNGAMRVTAPDGLASIEIAGRVIWQNGHMVGDPQFATDEGYFHDFTYDAATGRLTYTYTLTGATQEHGRPGADHIAHTLPITVRDADGDAASSSIMIVIRDDVAGSVADTNTLTEGEQTEVSGNLLQNDTSGADGWMEGSLTLMDAAGNAQGMTVEGKYGTLTIEADGSYTYSLKPEYKLGDKANLPDDVEDEVFHYQVKDADGDVTENTLTIDLVNTPFEPTKPTEPGDSELKANSIEFTLTDTAAAGEGVASQNKGADLFDGPHDVKSAVFGSTEGIEVEGAAGTFDWSVSEDGRTLTGTGANTVLTVTIGEVKTDGTVEMTATMTDPAGHAVNSDSISITGIAVTGTDVAGNTATNANVSITIADATPESTADTNTLTEGEQTEVSGNLLANDTAGADGWMDNSLQLIDKEGNLTTEVEGKYGTLTIEADGSYTYSLKDEYKLGEKANLPEDLEDEVFHYQVKDADGDVTENTLTIDLVNTPFEPTEPGSDNLEGKSIKFEFSDADAAGEAEAGQDKAADLFDGPHDVKSAVFGSTEGIEVEGAAGTFDWSVSEDGKTLTGTGVGTVLTVTITGVNADGTVAMTATMTDPAGHAVDSNGISITGIAVTGTDVVGNTATNANVSITIADAEPESVADSNTLTEGEQTEVTGNLLENDTAGADGWLYNSLQLIDKEGNLTTEVEGKYGTLTIEADGSYTYSLKDEYRLGEKANLPDDVEDEVFHYQVKDADGDVTENTLTIDLVNTPFEPTEPGDSELKANSIEFTLTDTAAAGDAEASQDKAADLFDGPHDVKSAVFGSTEGIEVEGANGTFDWSVSEDGKTLTGTGVGTVLTVSITGVNSDGTVSMTATMTDPAGHAVDSNGISITGIAVTGTDVAGNTATNANVSITIADAEPESVADSNTLTEGEQTEVTGNLLENDTAGADGWLDNSLQLIDKEGNLTTEVEGKYGTLTIEADGSYTYTLKDEYKLGEKANLPEDVEDEVFHYQVKDADGDVTENTLTIDLVNKPFEPTEPGSDNLEGKSIKFEFSDADAAGDAEAGQDKAADLFDGPHDVDVDKVAFGSTDGIKVDGADGTFDWSVSEDGKTLTGTGAGTKLIVTIGEVKADGTVSMTATMTDPAGHAVDSNGISITGIAVTGTDVAGNTATNANVSITIADAAPQAAGVTTENSGLSYENYASASFVGDFSSKIPDGAYVKPETTLNDAHGGTGSYWTHQYMEYYTGKGANDKAHGSYDGIVDGIIFIPTSAHYTFASDGSLLSVSDSQNNATNYRDKNFYLTNKGLTVGSTKNSLSSAYQDSKYVWNENEVGLAPANSSSSVYSEAIMIEQPKNHVAYGVTLDLGSIEAGDRILLTFYLTPQNSDVNNLVKTVILDARDYDVSNGTLSTTIHLPDGFTKLMVSALPSADGKHNSGFTLQGVAFGKPVYETGGTVAPDVDYGADGAAASDALAWSFDDNGWTKQSGTPEGVTKYLTDVTIEGGFGKGTYQVEITIDENGVMTGILKGGPANGLAGRVLFEGHFDAEKGTWEFSQRYNFAFKDGTREIIATLTATDADGDGATNQLHIALTDTPLERFDQVHTGYYDFDKWLSDESKDTATDFMAGENINDLIYSKGGDDIISGDGGSAALKAVLGADGLNLATATQNAILNNVNKAQAPNDAMTNNAGKVYAAIEQDAAGFAKKLDALEDQHKDWAGSDTIYGGNGKDVLLGWGGNDYLEGDAGRDFLFAGNGNDIIVYDAADAYIDGGRGFDILLANKGTGNLATLTNVHRVNMLIRSEREDDVKSLSINTLASLEQYGITITAAGAVVLVGENNWYWSTAKGAWVYSDDDGPLLSLEVAPGVTVTQAAQATGEAVGLADDAPVQASLGEDMLNDSALDTAGDNSPLFAMQKEAGMGEDGADSSITPAASATSVAAPAGRNVIQGDEDEPNLLFGTDGDDVIIGGAAGDIIDGGAGSDTIYAGGGDDLIVYDPTDYLIDGGAGIDFLLSDGQGTQYTLAEMLENYRDQTDVDKPMVNDVEVMIKGVDTTGLQNMDALAAKYGFSLGKDADGRDVLILGEQWKEVEGSANGVTTTYENGDGVTLETTLQSATESDLGEQAAQNIVLSSNG